MFVKSLAKLRTMSRPDVPTTAEQWQVMAWGAIVLLVILGAVGLYVEWRAPNIELAERARYLNFIAWSVALGIYLIKRVLTRVIS